AQLGVVLFMFLVGMELDTDVIRRRTSLVLTIAVGGMVVAFTIGAALARGTYSQFSGDETPFPLLRPVHGRRPLRNRLSRDGPNPHRPLVAGNGPRNPRHQLRRGRRCRRVVPPGIRFEP